MIFTYLFSIGSILDNNISGGERERREERKGEKRRGEGRGEKDRGLVGYVWNCFANRVIPF